MNPPEIRNIDDQSTEPARSWREVIASGDDIAYKEQINLLLFQILPPDATLSELETIAVSVYDMVGQSYEAHEPKDGGQ